MINVFREVAPLEFQIPTFSPLDLFMEFILNNQVIVPEQRCSIKCIFVAVKESKAKCHLVPFNSSEKSVQSPVYMLNCPFKLVAASRICFSCEPLKCYAVAAHCWHPFGHSCLCLALSVLASHVLCSAASLLFSMISNSGLLSFMNQFLCFHCYLFLLSVKWFNVLKLSNKIHVCYYFGCIHCFL